MIDNFEFLQSRIDELKKSYKYYVYGKSMLGQDLIGFHIGKYTNKQMLITGGIHAREYISTCLCLYLVQNLKTDVGCYILPMLNPDGIRLCLDGIKWIKDEQARCMIKRINKSQDFSLFKANAFGVDLNENFDAGFGEGNFIKFLPNSNGYLGEKSNSYENKYLLNFVKKKKIAVSLSYHSKGEVVYYGFCKLNKKQLKISKKLAKIVSKTLKFKKVRSKNSFAGFSDYMSYVKNIPSVTIELGSDNYSHPIEFDKLDEIKKSQIDMIKNVAGVFCDANM